jgi:polyribonucleotide nucleotidyltransferase
MTAWQMDLKIKGLTFNIMEEALEQAIQGRMKILDIMSQTINRSRPDLSPYAPRVTKIVIDKEKIGLVIGPGGKTIRSIIEETGTTIDIEDDGTVLIGSTDRDAARKAEEIILGLTKEVEVGTMYTGKVVRIMSFGAFVEILPGKDGMVHISELSDHRVESIEDEVKVGDELKVMVTEIDSLGRINLSHRAVMESVSGVGTDGGDRRNPSGDSRPPRTEFQPERRESRPPDRRPLRGDRDRGPRYSGPPRDRRR